MMSNDPDATPPTTLDQLEQLEQLTAMLLQLSFLFADRSWRRERSVEELLSLTGITLASIAVLWPLFFPTATPPAPVFPTAADEARLHALVEQMRAAEAPTQRKRPPARPRRRTTPRSA
jgi:hypothetical protein